MQQASRRKSSFPHSFELASLRPVGSGLLVYPVVRCRHCGQAWRYEWADLWEFIPPEMQARPRVYKDAFVGEPISGTAETGATA